MPLHCASCSSSLTPTATSAMPRNDLERQVFGGSESELSSDEDDEVQQREQPVLPQKTRPSKPRDDYESSAGESEDDYVQSTQPSSVGKAKKRLSRKSANKDDGEPKLQRKRKRQQPVEVDLNDLPPEQANKIRLDMKIDEILRSKKSKPRKKKNNDEVLDSFADDEVARLRETMNNAADEDIRSNQDKLPATAKLRLLPEAMDTLRKASLAQSMIDNNLLEAVRRWLEPLPDRSLPALNIQREFFNIIKKMEFIDSAVLKESGLGRIVLFYTKCKRVNPDITRIANDLVSVWSRPIIKRSASYRDRIVPVAADQGDGVDMRAGERLNAILARAKQAEKGRIKRNAVMIPQRELGTYTVAPKTNAGIGRGSVSVDVDVERRRKNAERLRSLTRKVNLK
ncbi:transcription factor iws1 [Pholiota conissans]|uniref:Transcription factor iws1 n=1 Tax=Pholiota conissans TaxID=109636 RepID=A0A9P6CYS6_9AGAR|nr:transcription factor iws1 [Pholiota conissans]